MKLSNNTRVWLHGLGAAFIGSGASSLGSALVDPAKFNVTSPGGVRNLILASGISGVVAVTLYLRNSPLPSMGSTTTELQKDVTVSETGAVTATATKVTTVIPPQTQG